MTTVPVDVDTLRCAIQEKYTEVAIDPKKSFHFHTGRFAAARFAYDSEAVEGMPDSAVESFAGVGNPFSLGPIHEGETVLDVGSGGGFDSFIAAGKVGTKGKVIGVDMTDEMLDKARGNARLVGMNNVEFRKGYAEDLPLPDQSVDVVISNGVINLCPDKTRVFQEIRRVLKPGGRLMIADIVVQKTVPDAAKENIDLWTG